MATPDATVIRADGVLPEVTRTFDEQRGLYCYQYGTNPHAFFEVMLSDLAADVDAVANRLGDWLEGLDRRELEG